MQWIGSAGIRLSGAAFGALGLAALASSAAAQTRGAKATSTVTLSISSYVSFTIVSPAPPNPLNISVSVSTATKGGGSTGSGSGQIQFTVASNTGGTYAVVVEPGSPNPYPTTGPGAWVWTPTYTNGASYGKGLSGAQTVTLNVSNVGAANEVYNATAVITVTNSF